MQHLAVVLGYTSATVGCYVLDCCLTTMATQLVSIVSGIMGVMGFIQIHFTRRVVLTQLVSSGNEGRMMGRGRRRGGRRDFGIGKYPFAHTKIERKMRFYLQIY